MLLGKYSRHTLNQSDASKFRVLVTTHRQYISHLGDVHLSINQQSEINRLSRDSCMYRPYVCFMVRKGDALRATLAIYIKIVILKLPNNSQVLYKRKYSELPSLMSLRPIFNDPLKIASSDFLTRVRLCFKPYTILS